MVDLHCHILPGLDDGAVNLGDSVAMARQAEDDGIDTVCATPHIRHDHRVEIGEIAGRVAALQRSLAARGLHVRVVAGGEVAEEEIDRLEDSQLARVALGGAGGWLLLEPAPGPLGGSLLARADRLAARGMRVIIAHPERHAATPFVERLSELVAHGCLIQWTAEFVALAKDEDLVLDLAAAGLVHLLGSDAHSARAGRPARLSAGFARLRGVCSPALMSWMIDAGPRAIVRGQATAPPK